MTTNQPIRLIFLLCMLFAVAAAAAADSLNLKPGLWEVTSTSETKGAPPISAAEKAEMEQAMAKMPPEQKAKIEAAVKSAQANLARPVVKKGCISKEDLSKPFDFQGGRGDGVCTRTILKSTSTMQEIRLECVDGTKKSGGTLRVVAASPEAWTGSMEGSMSDTGGAAEMKVRMSAKWVSADCGNARPLIQK